MKGRHLYLFGLLVALAGICSTRPAYAQDAHEIKGIVVDSIGQTPLPGVTIVVKGTSNGAATAPTGEFSIRAASNAVLVVSYIGYDRTEVPVGGRTNIRITLSQSKTMLNETVVIGYGAMKKSSVTAAVTKVENTILDQVPAGRPEAALVGRLAGVNISQNRAQPGQAPTIRIRGASSIDAGNEPLVVIDGVPGGNLGMINMNDVQSIEVLKDASSAAIYGSRAAGGVIIVTMKKGSAGKTRFNFNGFAGISKSRLHDDWMTGQEYYDYAVKFQNREWRWANPNADISIPVWGDARRPATYQVNPVLNNGANVIWQDEVMQTAPMQSYNISASGGTEKMTYYVSGTYKDEIGTMKNTWFKSYGVRANVDVKASKAVSIGFMLNPSYSKRRMTDRVMSDFAKIPSFVEVQRPDGTYPRPKDYWGGPVSSQTSPSAILNGTYSYGATFSNVGEAYLKVDLAKGLSLRSSVGSTIAYNNSDFFQTSYALSNFQNNGNDISTSNINMLNENVLSYNTSFRGGHDLSAIAGASYQKNRSKGSYMYAVPNSFVNETIHTLNNAVIDPTKSYTANSAWGLVSYFSRVHYGYKEKYLLSASIRTDGSSRFGANNKWGYFPSASVAWRIKQEDFMKDLHVVSDLKVRGSWGITGNFNIGDFQYLGQIKDAIYSPNNTPIKGQAQSNFENNDLGWEKTRGWDVGIEIGLLKNRIQIVADYYSKRTYDLLYQVTVPASTGFVSGLSNIGDVSNRGFEIELTTRNILQPDFTWQTNFNLAMNKNRVEDLGGVKERISTDGTTQMSWILRVGEPMFSYYGYRTIGVFNDAASLGKYPSLAGTKPGNPIFEDTNGDGFITPADKQLLGNFQPKAILGMVNNFTYRNFDLSIAMQASLGAKMFTYENQFYQGALLGAMRRSIVANQWWSDSETGDGRMPGSALSTLTRQSGSDIYIEDASFLAVRNINLGYTLPDAAFKRLGINSFRAYLSAGNPFIFTKKGFHGYNPEGSTLGEIGGVNSRPGYNSGSEPISRVYAIGFNFNF
ncbi:SusC/RagA family TonB-linked outer membrane protein [Chitinophaga rhizosphaerae]|uniref:SusC/RagA family TonB-linked outer membrane protein n=1 Tax=Chitinophaga rhizosphaerae TaxID=1864947 RepID=UPI000F80471D|nr:TonB-dependent receptor [Chitinophaga rhizosphaerae]